MNPVKILVNDPNETIVSKWPMQLGDAQETTKKQKTLLKSWSSTMRKSFVTG